MAVDGRLIVIVRVRRKVFVGDDLGSGLVLLFLLLLAGHVAERLAQADGGKVKK